MLYTSVCFIPLYVQIEYLSLILLKVHLKVSALVC